MSAKNHIYLSQDNFTLHANKLRRFRNSNVKCWTYNALQKCWYDWKNFIVNIFLLCKNQFRSVHTPIYSCCLPAVPKKTYLFSNPKLWILNRLMLKPCFEKNFPPNQFHWFHCGWCAGPSVRWSTNWAAGGAHRRVGHYQLVLESRPVFYYRHPLSPFHQLLLFQWYWSTANWSTGRQTHRAVNEYNPEFVHMVHTLHCDLPHVNCGKKCQTKLPWPPTIHSEPPTTFTFTFRNGWGTICTQNDGIARIGFVDKSSNKILAMPAFWVHMVPQPLP